MTNRDGDKDPRYREPVVYAYRTTKLLLLLAVDRCVTIRTLSKQQYWERCESSFLKHSAVTSKATQHMAQ